MTLTILNPHADDFIAEPVSFRLVSRRALKKYSYLLSEQMNSPKKAQILIDGTISSLIPEGIFSKLPNYIRHAVLKWEIKKWLELNNLTDEISVHWSVDTIEDKSALYLFSYKNCTGDFDKRLSVIESFALKVINLSHFMIRTSEKGRNAQRIKNAIYVSEANLSQNPFFEQYFGKQQKVIALPFLVAERFKCLTPFADRLDKCAVTGSFHDLTRETPHKYYQDFIDFYKIDTYHPARKMLYANKENLAQDFDCKVSPYRENQNNIFKRLDLAQKKYFSFDIVDFYNQHKYALVGEEIHGLSAVGAFEAMACGCVLIAQKGSFYNGLDLEAGVHYVEHDGSLKSIRETMNWLRAYPEKSVEISENAKKYVQENCHASVLWLTLNNKVEAYNKG